MLILEKIGNQWTRCYYNSKAGKRQLNSKKEEGRGQQYR